MLPTTHSKQLWKFKKIMSLNWFSILCLQKIQKLIQYSKTKVIFHTDCSEHFFYLALTERYMQIRFDLKVVLKFWHRDILMKCTRYVRNNISRAKPENEIVKFENSPFIMNAMLIPSEEGKDYWILHSWLRPKGIRPM